MIFLLGIVLFVILYAIWRLLIHPYILYKFYKNQKGAEGYFSIGMRFYENLKRDVKIHGDYVYYFQKTIAENPTCRFIVLNYAHTPILYLTDPQLIKDFVKNIQNYEKAYEILTTLKDSKGKGIITQEGEKWKKSRKLYSNIFHFEAIKTAIPWIIKITTEKLNSNERLNKIKVVDFFTSIIGEIVGQFFFGKNFSNYKIDGMPLIKFFGYFTYIRSQVNFSTTAILFGNRFVKLGLTSLHRKMNYLQNLQDKTFSSIILECKRGIHSKNSLIGLISDLDGTSDAYTIDKIITEFRTLSFAGTETTSNLLSTATYYISKHSEAEKKILEEAKRELSDLESLSLENINRMDYTLAFLKECLRLTPPVGPLIPRVALTDHYIGDIKVKKGTFLSIPTPALQRNPYYYTEPDKFIPERHLKEGVYPEDRWRSEPFIFQAFHSGPRNCIGQNLALIEARLVLGLTLLKYKFQYPEDFKLRMNLGFLYTPDEPFTADFIPRNSVQL